MERDSVQNTIRVAVLLCLVCSILVSGFAVVLRPIQETNRRQFMQENILKAAGLWEDGANVQELFERHEVTPRIVDLEIHRYANMDTETFDQEKASRDPKLSDPVTDDIANIKRREKYSFVYEIRTDGELQTIVLPIRGYGLWSTLYGFIALDLDDLTDGGPKAIEIRGLTYYKHGETPGLGGEVDNVQWKARWNGKRAYDADWNVKIEVAKGASGDYQVDSLAGATITSRGVTNMLAYWLGDQGFGPFLQQLQSQSTAATADAATPDAVTTGGEQSDG